MITTWKIDWSKWQNFLVKMPDGESELVSTYRARWMKSDERFVEFLESIIPRL